MNATSVGSVEDLFDETKTPDDVYIDLITQHVEQYNDREQQFEAILPILRQSFQTRLERAIHEGRIPQIVSEVANRRMGDLDIVLVDALSTHLDDYTGAYNVDAEQIKIAEQTWDDSGEESFLDKIFGKRPQSQDEEQEVPRTLEHVYTHEMLHFLAGRTILSSVDIEQDFEGEIIHQRGGLRYNTPNRRFQWLNEAVTEGLAVEFMGGKDKGIYRRERELLRLLQTKGKTELPEDLFIDAYFENYDPNILQKDRIPAWKKLQQAINKAYEPGFLVQIDNVVRNEGTAKAIEVLNQRPPAQ